RAPRRDSERTEPSPPLPALAQLAVRVHDLAHAPTTRLPGRVGRARARAGGRSPPSRRRARADRAAPAHASTAPMTQRVALVALTTTGAAGDYVAALGTALGGRATVGMWIPDRPALQPDGVETHVVAKASTRAGVAGHEAVAWLRSG